MLKMSAEYHYYFCTDNVTLRYRHRGLREYIRSKLDRDPVNGDVYIFLSRDCKRLRVYYFHDRGEILIEKILHNDHYIIPVFADKGRHVHHIAWSDFVYLSKRLISNDRHEHFDEEPEG